MAYIIYTSSENMSKSITDNIIRIPKSLIDQFDLRRLKSNDKIFLFNYEDEKLYGTLRVVEEYYEEKNPKSGPFNGYGKVKNHYYYFSIKIDSSDFSNNGLSIKKLPELDLKSFIVDISIEKKLIEIFKALNFRTIPIVIETRYTDDHFVISVLNVKNGIMLDERSINIDRSFIDLLKKKSSNLQMDINIMDYNGFLTNSKDIGEYLYEMIFKYLELKELFQTGGYSISFISDDVTVKLPLSFVYCCGAFLFEKNYISYLMKNKTEMEKKISVNRVLILADPGNRYKWSYEEGKKLFKFFSDNDIECDFISRPLSDLNLISIFEDYQLVHITGHGESYKIDNYDLASLDTGKSLFHLRKLNSLKRLPALIFFNICSNSIKWGLNLLKNKNIGNIILSRWNFPDTNSFDFILNFYELLLKGVEIGKAFNIQKMKALNQNNRENLLPFLYQQLGDSGIKYVF